MRFANRIRISVFVKPEDRIEQPDIDERLIVAMKNLVPFDLGQEKIPIDKEIVEGFNQRSITIHKVTMEKETHTTAFIRHLVDKLNPDQKELLLRQKESRLDENLDFFIRLGKQELLRDDCFITDSGDCIHIRIRIAAFPKKREAALKVIEQIFKSANI